MIPLNLLVASKHSTRESTNVAFRSFVGNDAERADVGNVGVFFDLIRNDRSRKTEQYLDECLLLSMISGVG